LLSIFYRVAKKPGNLEKPGIRQFRLEKPGI